MKSARDSSKGRARRPAPPPPPAEQRTVEGPAPEPGEVAAGGRDLTQVVGGNLRRIRNQRGLSLERLS